LTAGFVVGEIERQLRLLQNATAAVGMPSAVAGAMQGVE